MTTITPLHHIRVALERNPYDVVIGAGSLASLGQQMLDAGVQPGRRVLVVSNPDVAAPYGEVCLQSLRLQGFHADLLETPIRWEDGMVIPSIEPGLGVVLNEEVALAHPYDGDDLHLEAGGDPMPVTEGLAAE
mgnify:CR=1 FL=1